jgi:tetratricopeptide (TPR) repeat protein
MAGLEEAYNRFVKSNPAEVDAALTLSRIRQARGRHTAALKDLENLKKDFPGDIRVYEAMTESQNRLDKPAEERATYYEMLSRFPGADSLYFPVAETFERESMPDSALSAYRLILSKRPEAAYALARTAGLYEARNALDSALVYYKRWAEAVPESPAPLAGQGRVLEALKQPVEALVKYAKAESLGGNAETAQRLFFMHKARGNIKAAKAVQEKALFRLVSEIINGEKALAASLPQGPGLLARLGHKPEGEKALWNSRDVLLRLTRGWIPSAADPALDTAINRLLDEHPQAAIVMELLARQAARRRAWDEAAAHYEALLSISPGFLEGQKGLAKVYEKQGRLDEALAARTRIVEMDLSNADAYGSAVRLAEKLGALEPLAARWEALGRAYPYEPELKRNLIMVWNKLGRNDKVAGLLKENKRKK